MTRSAIVVAVFVSSASLASAHHGGGTFDGPKEIKLTTGSDVIGVADLLPYKPDPCKELGFLDYSKEAKT